MEVSNIDADGAIALVDYLVLGFDVDLLTKKENGAKFAAIPCPDVNAIDKDKEYKVPILPEMSLKIAYNNEGAIEFHNCMIAPMTAIQAMAQVLDCTVFLQGGKVVPYQYVKKIAPLTFKQVHSITFQATLAKPTLEPSLGCPSLKVGKPVSAIMARGPLLLAKGMTNIYVWMYKQNTGIFMGPIALDIDADGTIALTDDSVLGFDVDLLTRESHAIMCKASFSFNADDGSVGESTTMRQIFLPKNRTKAKIVVGPESGLFVLAHKKDGTKHLGHLFQASNGKLQKLPGAMKEGRVEDIVANEMHLFVLTIKGGVFDKDGARITMTIRMIPHSRRWKSLILTRMAPLHSWII